MNLATIIESGVEKPVLVDLTRGVIPAYELAPDTPDDLLAIIQTGRVEELVTAAINASDRSFRPREGVVFTAPYRHPRLILGIGLNYVDHAADLSEVVPEEPASFIKGDHTIIGPGEPIPIPPQSSRTTSEAEMGIIIGKYCRDVSESEALDFVLGVCPVLDQTTEDILQRNPRFLTRSKNYPGFFSFGPEIVSLEEASRYAGNLESIKVSTIVNAVERRANIVARMRFSPAFLVSFHSKAMPLHPGDIISPGTPGAIRIRPGDTAECHIPGVGVLQNPVVSG